MVISVDFGCQVGHLVCQSHLATQVVEDVDVGRDAFKYVVLRMIHSEEDVLDGMAEGGKAEVGAAVEDLAEHFAHREVVLSLFVGYGGLVVVTGGFQKGEFVRLRREAEIGLEELRPFGCAGFFKLFKAFLGKDPDVVLEPDEVGSDILKAL